MSAAQPEPEPEAGSKRKSTSGGGSSKKKKKGEAGDAAAEMAEAQEKMKGDRNLVQQPTGMTGGTLKPYLSTLIGGDGLSFEESRSLFGAFFDGTAAPEEVAAVLCCLRQKGESFEEVAGAATAMRDACVRVDAPGTLLDIVGTGGDGACTINLSTCSAILAAACGAKVTKCGNRSVSSACGAADVLEALGLDLELELDDVASCIEDVGLGFLYAPKNHPAMRFVAPVRKALGVRTAFNLLGPLTNAASAQRVVIGVFDEALVELLIKTWAGFLAELLRPRRQSGLLETTIRFSEEGSAFAPTCAAFCPTFVPLLCQCLALLVTV